MEKRKVWTEKEIIELKKLNNKGNTPQEIADALKRTKGSVHTIMYKLKIKSKSKRKGKKTPYIYKIGEVVGDGTLRIIKQIRVKNSQGTIKGYVVKSLKYPDDKNDYEISEGNLKSGQRCAYVTNKRIIEENSLWSKIELRKYIVDTKQAKMIAPNHYKHEIRVRCDNCNKEKMILPTRLVQYGILCKTCEKGISYPELLFMSYSEEKDAGFVPQQRFKDFPNHIFDSVNYERRIIVETHGMAHYKERDGFHDHKRTVESDKRKRQYCKENNWTLIELDCRISDFEFIRNSIANEPLLQDITEGDIEGILEIIANNKRYPTKEIIDLYTINFETTTQIAQRFKICADTVTRILRNNGVKIRNARESSLKGKLLDENNIIILYENGASSTKIAEKYGVSTSLIYRILIENNIKIRNNGESHSISVKCIETGVIYPNMLNAAKSIGLKSSTSISNVINGRAKTAGGYHWELVN